MENRIINVEAGIANLTTQLIGFEQRINELFNTVDVNDRDMKTRIQNSMDGFDTRIAGVAKINKDTGVALNEKIGSVEDGLTKKTDTSETGFANALTMLDSKVQGIETVTAGLTPNRIEPMEVKVTQVDLDLNTLGSFVKTRIQEIETYVQGLGYNMQQPEKKDFDSFKQYSNTG